MIVDSIYLERICLALIPVIIFFKESFLMLPMGVYREYWSKSKHLYKEKSQFGVDSFM